MNILGLTDIGIQIEVIENGFIVKISGDTKKGEWDDKKWYCRDVMEACNKVQSLLTEQK